MTMLRLEKPTLTDILQLIGWFTTVVWLVAVLRADVNQLKLDSLDMRGRIVNIESLGSSALQKHIAVDDQRVAEMQKKIDDDEAQIRQLRDSVIRSETTLNSVNEGMRELLKRTQFNQLK